MRISKDFFQKIFQPKNVKIALALKPLKISKKDTNEKWVKFLYGMTTWFRFYNESRIFDHVHVQQLLKTTLRCLLPENQVVCVCACVCVETRVKKYKNWDSIGIVFTPKHHFQKICPSKNVKIALAPKW